MIKTLLASATILALAIPAYADTPKSAAHHHHRAHSMAGFTALVPLPIDPLHLNPPAASSAPAATTPGTGILSSVQTITVADLENALADANAQTPPVGATEPAPYNATVTGGDTRHGNCWAALIQFDNAFQATNILPQHPGLALLQQKIFDDQQLVGKPLIPDYVATQCALTFLDAQMNFAQITTLLGIKAITLPKI